MSDCEICKFKNPKMTVTAIAIKNGKVLVLKRSVAPEKGKWDFPGGFLNQKEAPEQALMREIKEELGTSIKHYVSLGFFAGTYKWKTTVFPIVTAAYFVQLGKNFNLDPENSAWKWMNPINLNIAFDSNKILLKKIQSIIIDFHKARELTSQLDSTANINEFNLYAAQFNGYISKKYDKKKLIGMGWIFPRQTMLRNQAVIEDMIVDEAYRGKGYGKEIVLDLIHWARDNGVEIIELTSNPKRIAANELYKKVGFILHPTNHYLMKVK